MKQIVVELTGPEDERRDIASRLFAMCLQIGKITRHYKKESDAYPLNPDADVVIVERGNQ